MKKQLLPTLLLASVIFLGSCTQRHVTRVDPDKQTDLSGRWNDTDNRLVAEDMIDQSIDKSWRTEFETNNSRKPVIIVG